jgi:hypothetical protein
LGLGRHPPGQDAYALLLRPCDQIERSFTDGN